MGSGGIFRIITYIIYTRKEIVNVDIMWYPKRMKQIAFIGIGVMGASMAGHLLSAGYDMRLYARTPAKAAALAERGATLCGSVAECVRAADAVITIVGYPKDVEEVYFGPDGILQNARKGAILIDMTTTDPQLSVRIHAEAQKRGLSALDAPVSGGDKGARNAALSIMCGGDKAAFDLAVPLFAVMGKTYIYTGKAGSGQHTKMANQIALCGAIAGLCEALLYAEKKGLDPANMLSCISGGAAGSWQMSNVGPRILNGDFDPGFFICHQTKDLRIAKDNSADFDLPVMRIVADMYEAMEAEGQGALGTQALINYYRAHADD